MKTKILLVFALICMIAMKMLAQNPPGIIEACEPDCFQTRFPAPTLHATVTLANGCQVDVQYCTRFACNIWHDLYIANVTALNLNDPICAAYFATQSTAQLLNDATQQMLLTNPMGFPPNPMPDTTICESNWRVAKGACWSKYTFNYGSPANPSISYRLSPCGNSVVCCLDYYMVCVDSDGTRHITQLPGSVKGVCGSQTPPVPGATCEPVCD